MASEQDANVPARRLLQRRLLQRRVLERRLLEPVTRGVARGAAWRGVAERERNGSCRGFHSGRLLTVWQLHLALAGLNVMWSRPGPSLQVRRQPPSGGVG